MITFTCGLCDWIKWKRTSSEHQGDILVTDSEWYCVWPRCLFHCSFNNVLHCSVNIRLSEWTFTYCKKSFCPFLIFFLNLVSVSWNGRWYQHVLALCALSKGVIFEGPTVQFFWFYVCVRIGFVDWLEKRFKVLKCAFAYDRFWFSRGDPVWLTGCWNPITNLSHWKSVIVITHQTDI